VGGHPVAVGSVRGSGVLEEAAVLIAGHAFEKEDRGALGQVEQVGFGAVRRCGLVDLFGIGGDDVVVLSEKGVERVRLSLRGRDNERILPATYSDNYFWLLPGESRTVTATAGPGAPTTSTLKLLVDPYNH
jgi:hypothetical protein